MLGKCFVCLVSFLFQFSCLQCWRFTKSYPQDATILGIVFNLFRKLFGIFDTRHILQIEHQRSINVSFRCKFSIFNYFSWCDMDKSIISWEPLLPHTWSRVFPTSEFSYLYTFNQSGSKGKGRVCHMWLANLYYFLSM